MGQTAQQCTAPSGPCDTRKIKPGLLGIQSFSCGDVNQQESQERGSCPTAVLQPVGDESEGEPENRTSGQTTLEPWENRRMEPAGGGWGTTLVPPLQ